MTNTISQDEYSKELIKWGFPEKMLSSPQNSKNLLEYCNQHDMKYLKKSE